MNNFTQMKTNFINKINDMDEQQYYDFWEQIEEILEFNNKLGEFSNCTFTCSRCKEKYGVCGDDMPCFERFLKFCTENKTV